MKKIFLYLLLVAVLAFYGCGRTENIEITELLMLISEEQTGENGKGVFYTRNADGKEGFLTLDENSFGRLYSGRYEPPVCMDRIEDYAVRLPVDDSGYEIHIIKCLNRSDSEEISMMLQSRIEKIQNLEILEYAPENFEKYYRGAVVVTVGRYAVLLATPDNKLAEKTIKKYL